MEALKSTTMYRAEGLMKSLETLRKDLLFDGRLEPSNPETPVTLTWGQLERLFACLQGMNEMVYDMEHGRVNRLHIAYQHEVR